MPFDRTFRKLAIIWKPRGILCILLGFFLGCIFTITNISQFTGRRLPDAGIIPIGIPMSELTKRRLLSLKLLSLNANNRFDSTHCINTEKCVLIPTGLSPNAVSISLISKNVASIRILCMILTMPDNHSRKARAVKQTWASRCDGYFFVSSENDTQLSA
ncbi:hypothetical protein PHET_06503 [Paragonimus heterotremus]|uniref:Uncharacterized protein n=1 Tax=Paragonimus heterotremus TaxID=100268 RepID=A0A8J4WHV1_9TREM|nr:hypothetical protein PHET_06503 [Paragonimus heterotremus]